MPKNSRYFACGYSMLDYMQLTYLGYCTELPTIHSCSGSMSMSYVIVHFHFHVYYILCRLTCTCRWYLNMYGTCIRILDGHIYVYSTFIFTFGSCCILVHVHFHDNFYFHVHAKINFHLLLYISILMSTVLQCPSL